MAPLPLRTPYPESRATLDGLFGPVRRYTTFMGDIDDNQYQLNHTTGALQRTNVARQNLAVSNEEAKKRHHLSTYKDDEKKWLVKTEEEERQKGRVFMERLKRRWDEQYPEKRNVSKQNLRDNAVGFKKGVNIDQETNEGKTNNVIERVGNVECTNEMNINLLRIEDQERSKGRGSMKRMKEAWDLIYDDKPLSAQCLRDNAARIRKDKQLMNLIEVRDERDLEINEMERNEDGNATTEGDLTAENNEGEVFEIAQQNTNNDRNNNEENEQNNAEQREEEAENENISEIRIRFVENLERLKQTKKENFEERECLMKLKERIRRMELENVNKVLEKHLSNTDDICKIVDAVYAMGRTIEERLGLKRGEKKKKKGNKGENKRIRKMEKRLKESRQLVGWTANEIHRRKVKRKATKKEKKIL